MMMEMMKKHYWKRRGPYNKSPTNNKRSTKSVARLGAGNSDRPKRRRPWRLRLAPKLRLAASPLKLWSRLRNAYMKMMVRLAHPSTTRGVHRLGNYTRSEFDNRLILEIYKSMAASLELGYTK